MHVRATDEVNNTVAKLEDRSVQQEPKDLPAEDDRRYLLPAPTETERADFVVQMRDLASRLPEHAVACAYERILLATGERDAALFSLQLSTGVALVHAEEVPLDPIAGAVAFIIGDASLKTDFGAWTVGELLTLLSLWGAEIGWGFWVIVIIFGMLHGVTVNEGVLAVSFPAIFFTGFIGFILIWMRERTGSLLVPVLFHNIFNFVNAFV